MLYERNYFELTSDEKLAMNKALKPLWEGSNMKYVDYKIFPKAGHFYNSIFPNNMLDLDDLGENQNSNDSLNEFKVLLNNGSCTERELLNFTRDKRAYFIIASVLTEFHFGHHSAYAFPEFDLPPNFKVDYLIVGKSSYGHEFVFIELENPYNNITTKDGSLGITFRKGLKQVSDWKSWLESNFSHLKLMFAKYQNPNLNLPKEFLNYDSTRIHYVVVAGRRNNFNEETYKIARRMKSERIHIFHYDNLIDRASQVLKSKNYV